jgi:hypothetical protein
MKRWLALAAVACALLVGWQWYELQRLERAVQQQWQPLEEAVREQAQLVPQLFDLVVKVNTHGMSYRTPSAPPPASPSGRALLATHRFFGGFDAAQAEIGSLMFELCQGFGASSELRGDPRAQQLIQQLSSSLNRRRAAEQGFVRAAEDYQRARSRPLGRLVAASAGFPELPVRLSAVAFAAQPALVSGCPLIGAGSQTASVIPGVVASMGGGMPRSGEPPTRRTLERELDSHRAEWKPCALAAADRAAKKAQLEQASREQNAAEELRIRRETEALAGAQLKCGQLEARILGRLRAMGASEPAISEAWAAFLADF